MKPWRNALAFISDYENMTPSEQQKALADLEVHQPELISDVRGMLAMPSSFMETPYAYEWPTHLESELETIKDITILASLGQGGMGQVFQVREDGDVQREVALKVMGLQQNGAFHKRFQREFAFLARMNHHNIAQLYRTGETPRSKHPYFLMEYVDGHNIIKHCQLAQTSIKDRLRLFLQLCNGVMHAHQKMVIHRDLKPANILVSRRLGLVKIIDFGIARALDPNDSHQQTAQGVRLGTLAYMSPEQLEGRVDELDMRTDVYGLGAVLCHLLCGQSPYGDQLKGRNLTQMVSLLLTQDPTPPGKLNSELPTDLGVVINKALARNPDDRYQSVALLNDDIRRYLNQKPVLARQGSRFYRFKRFLQRNRIGVSFAAIILVAILSSVTIYFKGQQETIEALRGQTDALKVIEKVLMQTDPRKEGKDLTVVEATMMAFEEITYYESHKYNQLVINDITRIFAMVLAANGQTKESYELLCRFLPAIEEAHEQASKEGFSEYTRTKTVLISSLEALALVADRIGLSQESQRHLQQLAGMDGLNARQRAYARRGMANALMLVHPAYAEILFEEAANEFFELGLDRHGMVALRGVALTKRRLSEKYWELLHDIAKWQEDFLGDQIDTLDTYRLVHQNDLLELQKIERQLFETVGENHQATLKARYDVYRLQIEAGKRPVQECEALATFVEEVLGESALLWNVENLQARLKEGKDKIDHYEELLRSAKSLQIEPGQLWTAINNLASAYLKVNPTRSLELLLALGPQSAPTPALHYYTRFTLSETYQKLGQHQKELEVLSALDLAQPCPDGVLPHICQLFRERLGELRTAK